jgi:hypothetical protein
MSADPALKQAAEPSDQEAVAAVAAAVAAFLAQVPPAAGYREVSVAGRRALCRAGPTVSAAEEPLLLAGERGTAYVPRGSAQAPGIPEALGDALQRRGFQQTTSTLAVRLPADLGGAPRVYVLWATRAYLAAGAVTDQVWK